jgi:hypothetical protein
LVIFFIWQIFSGSAGFVTSTPDKGRVLSGNDYEKASAKSGILKFLNAMIGSFAGILEVPVEFSGSFSCIPEVSRANSYIRLPE